MTSEPALVPELTVTDIAASLASCIDVLGFSVRNARPGAGFALIEREGALIMLDRHGPGSRDTAPPEYPSGRGINYAIEVSDADALRARLAGPAFREIETVTYSSETGPLIVRRFCVQDPDGYLLRFQQAIADG